MSGFNPFNSGGGGSPVNIDTTVQHFGFGATGALTTVTANASNNTKGNWASLGTASSDLGGLLIFLGFGAASSTRYLVDIGVGDGTGGGTTVIIPNIYSMPGTGGQNQSFDATALNIANGSQLWARCQSNTGGSAIGAAAIGFVRVAAVPPLWNSCELLVAADTTNSRPSTVSVTAVTSANTGWTQYLASTSRAYGALVPVFGQTSTNPTTTQAASFRLGYGGSGAGDATLMLATPWGVVSGAAGIVRSPGLLTGGGVASGQRIAVEMLAGTAAAGDACLPQVYGFF